MSTSQQGALQGIRVLDLSRVLAGPWCTMTLADLGADVIKVESLAGDDTRTWGPPFIAGNGQQMSAYFSCANRNKKSIAVDLHTTEGQRIIHQLAAKADVVVENFKTGGATRLNVDASTLRTHNPGLIYCSISGYGRTGPWAEKPGYDFIIQAEAGLMSITGPADGQPSKIGVALADLATGMNATTAILAALIARGRTGKGQDIDISLFETQLQLLANVASNTLFSGRDAPRWGNAHANIVPYQAFAAADGWFAVAVGNDHQWQKLCTLLNQPDWAAPGHPYATNPGRVSQRAELVPLLAARFLTQPMNDWVTALTAAGIPCGQVNSVQAALNHVVAQSRGMLRQLPQTQLGADIPVVGSALHLSDTPVQYTTAPPVTGQDTQHILQTELNYTPETCAALAQAGVILGTS